MKAFSFFFFSDGVTFERLLRHEDVEDAIAEQDLGRGGRARRNGLAKRHGETTEGTFEKR